MRFLVTGGAGFIGSHLCRRLLDRGDSVLVLDNMSTGSMDNICDMLERAHFCYRIGSIMDISLVSELVAQCDVIVHLAAAVGVRLIIEKPVDTIITNIEGTRIVFQAASQEKKLVVLASSSEVYGKSHSIPFREEDDLTLGPTVASRWAYACSKALDEWLAFAYWREKGVPIIICRFFNTVGPGQTGQYGMVMPNFAMQALTGGPITVYGTGMQTRCFAHVKDTVEAILRLIDQPEATGGVFNIGSTEEVTILDLAKMFCEAIGQPVEIVRIPYTEAYEEGFEDMIRRVPNVEKLERTIDFCPRTPLKTIIADILDDQSPHMNRVGRAEYYVPKDCKGETDPVKSIPLTADGICLHVPIDNPLSRYYGEGNYERGTVLILKKYLRAGNVVLDIGAHVGYHSFTAAKYVGSAGEVIAFEPDPSAVTLFQQGCRVNGFTNVMLFQVALADREGVGEFYCMHSGLSSLLPPDRRHDDLYGDVLRVIRCEITTIDAFCKSRNVHPSLIKVDVEGTELSVLGGMRHILESCAPRLVVDLHGQDNPGFYQALTELDYRVERILDSGELMPLNCNYLAKTKETTIFAEPANHRRGKPC